MNLLKILIVLFVFSMSVNTVFSQNPLINTQFTADPTARVFEGKLYVYPSHDILCEKVEGKPRFFCMEDYHVFSTENLTDWKNHGVVLSQKNVPWVDASTFSMWAPDCVYKNSKYYFYFPAIAKDSLKSGNKQIGVATSTSPYGPFIPEKNFIPKLKGIDPNVFIDKDDKAYLYWATNKKIYCVKLKDNMLEADSEPVEIGTPTDKFREGPFVFERNGKYYLTYPFVNDKTEQLVYGMGDHPMGPFEYKGIIMKESPTKCWTNHQSIVQFKDQWYLFYHHNDYSPKFDKNRSIKADSLYFNKDGTIQEVIPTLRGVGITSAKSTIQLDRYSSKSAENVTSDYVDTLDYFKGWKLLFSNNGWVSYNKVDFSNSNFKKITLYTKAPIGGNFEIRLNSLKGPLIAKGKLDKVANWNTSTIKLKKYKSAVHDLYFITKGSESFELDYIKFEH